ncbi:hypothetical protein [Streptomyces sp. WAC06614]|uniref:hypothetical protein n=1 Tax=Streptomyces sp. WAC06614 TaxID=2487416 RepID=UPI000F78FE78|nr:hypothetical protein [Streptomyces sp. WAC06614]RSS66743.1 hypothetical protein EF918_29175 [Streptomyces sp. WAC06614]
MSSRVRRRRRMRLGRRRGLARWGPRAVARRAALLAAAWGVRMTAWAMRKALRRMLRAAL